MKQKKNSICDTISYCLAAIWTGITIFPLYVTVLSSLKNNEGINLGMFKWPEQFFWSNYSRALFSAHMGKAVFNSLFIALCSTLIVLFIGMLAAYVLSRKHFKCLFVINILIMVGVMVPVHTTIIPISSMASVLNGKDNYLYIIFVYAAFNISQAIFLFTGYLDSLNREIDEAAIIDGCNDFHLFFLILFPLSTPILTTEAILCFVFGYGELIFSMCLISKVSMYTVSRAMLAFSGGYQVEYGPIFASIVIAVVPMIIIYIVFHEKVQSGMLTGALKG